MTEQGSNIADKLPAFDTYGIMSRTENAYFILVTWQDEGKISFLPEQHKFVYPNIIDEHLASILGYVDTVEMQQNYREESTATMELLCGEHGWAIYQMLLARKALK